MVKPKKPERRKKFGKILEWDWFDLIAEAFFLLFRLVLRGIRALLD